MYIRWSEISSVEILLKSYVWHLERIVRGIYQLVVARMKRT